MVMLLDGGMGSELELRGIPIPKAPWWSAWALKENPAAVQEVHRAYASAGATIHTTNTFRTQRYNIGDEWAPLARKAVKLARSSVPASHRVAGSLAPIEHCYRPELSPSNAGEYHREVAEVLSDAGVDLLLCETFPSIREALTAVEACVATGLETWVSFTAGPQATVLSPKEVTEGARRAIGQGAGVILVNCLPATRALPYAEHLAELGIPFGIYTNGGDMDEGIGWHSDVTEGARRYGELAAQWVAAGASVVGGCCGVRPAHIAELHNRFHANENET